jgi:hypothetical protein
MKINFSRWEREIKYNFFFFLFFHFFTRVVLLLLLARVKYINIKRKKKVSRAQSKVLESSKIDLWKLEIGSRPLSFAKLRDSKSHTTSIFKFEISLNRYFLPFIVIIYTIYTNLIMKLAISIR